MARNKGIRKGTLAGASFRFFKSAIDDIFDYVPIGVAVRHPPSKLALIVAVLAVEGNGFLASEEFFGMVIASVRFLLGGTLVP